MGGIRRALREAHPRPAVRAMLAAEVCLYVGGMVAYLCLAFTGRGLSHWYEPAVWLLAAGFPIAMNLLHGDRPSDSGLRLDNLGPSAREAAIATAALAGAVVATGLAVGGFHWKTWGHFGERAAMYLAWGPIQQYMVQAFGLRRLRQAQLPPWAAAVAAAGLFSLLHAPNWPLVGLAFSAGVVWCCLFLRRPNLLTIGLSHAVLAVLAYYALPETWLHRLTVGRPYLRRLARAGQ